MTRFRAHYGCSPYALATLYHDLSQRPDKPNDFNVKDFLMGMNWLKLYDTYHVLAGRWGLHEETVGNRVFAQATFIQSFKEEKIRFEDFHDDEVFVISVAIRSSRIVWVNGPFPASRHDLTTFRGGKKKEAKDQSALQFKLKKGQRAVGDSGYQGEPDKITTVRDGHSAELKKWLSRVKARHETINTRLKFYKILEHRFRHGFKNHQMAMEAVCVAVQYDMEHGQALFEV